jgi:hypothetical protein
MKLLALVLMEDEELSLLSGWEVAAALAVGLGLRFMQQSALVWPVVAGLCQPGGH